MSASTLPTLVIVSGAPAAGKSTLARLLAAELRLPLLAKDGIKEVLGDSLGATDRARSKELGAASHALLVAIAGWLLNAGAGMILEANFWRGITEPSLRPLVARADAVLVHCAAAPDEILQRHAERHTRGERHSVHYDAGEVELDSVIRSGRFDPLDLPVPLLRVDTTNGYAPDRERILVWLRSLRT